MDRKQAVPFRWLVFPMLMALSSACASGSRNLNPTIYLEEMGLAESAVPSEKGTAAKGVSLAPLPSITPVPPPATYTPSVTHSPTAASTATETPSPTKRSFVYVFPVQPPGVVDFAEGGHPYPATDIFAPVGTHFVAVTDGVVDFVSYQDLWDPATNDDAVAGGLCVAIVGDDGIRYYGSHLSAIAGGIAPGVRVAAGQLLGLSGKTGNARNTTPHVHFGISRPSHPGDWAARRGQLDPYPYLIGWLHGENVTPVFPTPTLTPSPSAY